MGAGPQSFDLFMKNGNSQYLLCMACLIDLGLFVHMYVGIVAIGKVMVVFRRLLV